MAIETSALFQSLLAGPVQNRTLSADGLGGEAGANAFLRELMTQLEGLDTQLETVLDDHPEWLQEVSSILQTDEVPAELAALIHNLLPPTADTLNPPGEGAAFSPDLEVLTPVLGGSVEITAESDKRALAAERWQSVAVVSDETDLSSLDGAAEGVEPTAASPLTLVNAMSVAKDALPPLDKPLGQPAWQQGLGERILWLNQNSMPAAEIRLNPPELGPLEVRIRMQQDQATVIFASQHGAVREAVEAAIPRLREMFAAQHLNLADVQVSQQPLTGQEQQHRERSPEQGPGLAARVDIDAETSSVETDGSERVSRGLLSYYV